VAHAETGTLLPASHLYLTLSPMLCIESCCLLTKKRAVKGTRALACNKTLKTPGGGGEWRWRAAYQQTHSGIASAAKKEISLGGSLASAWREGREYKDGLHDGPACIC